jgi:diadenylate cyclase
MSILAIGDGEFIIRSIVDIVLVAVLLYRGLLVIRGTRAVPMVWGLIFIVAGHLLATQLGILTLAWLLGRFLDAIIIVIVVLFQDEIRRGLTKVGLQPILANEGTNAHEAVLEDLAVACGKFSKARTGALIVLQRNIGLVDLVEESVILDAMVSRKLLSSIFSKDSPLHDGAVVIIGSRIKAAGCVLPLTSNPDLDPNLGTRHRAAVGISERSDAVVLVVSEETGAISIVCEGKMTRNLDATALAASLSRYFGPQESAKN